MSGGNDSSDDELLAAPVFRSSKRAEAMKKRQREDTIKNLLSTSKIDLYDARRDQDDLKALQLKEAESARKVRLVKPVSNPAQSGFFEVEETEPLSTPERKRRLTMLKNMRENYDMHPYTISFDSKRSKGTFLTQEEALSALKGLLNKSETDATKLTQSFLSAIIRGDFFVRGLIFNLEHLPQEVVLPDFMAEWIWNTALSSGMNDMDFLGQACQHSLLQLLQRRRVNLKLDCFHSKSLRNILNCWGVVDVKDSAAKDEMTSDGAPHHHNLDGLMFCLEFCRVIFNLDPTLMVDDTAKIIYQKVCELCSSMAGKHCPHDVRLLKAARGLLSAIGAQMENEEDMKILIARLFQNPTISADSWSKFASIADLLQLMEPEEGVNENICKISAHASMMSLDKCLSGLVSLERKLPVALRDIEGNECVDVKSKPLSLQALCSGLVGLQALKTTWERMESPQDGTYERFLAIVQCTLLSLVSGTLLTAFSTADEECSGECRNHEKAIFKVFDGMGPSFDWLAAKGNRLAANDDCRRLNCWLMFFDHYRIGVLKKLKPRVEPDSGEKHQTTLKSFFVGVDA